MSMRWELPREHEVGATHPREHEVGATHPHEHEVGAIT